MNIPRTEHQRAHRSRRALLIGLFVVVAQLAAASTALAGAPVFGSGWYGTDIDESAPLNLSPVDATSLSYPDDPLVFQWGAVAGTSAYQIQIALQSSSSADCTASTAFTTGTIVVDTTVSSNVLVPTLTSSDESDQLWIGTYCWRVRSSVKGQWSAENKFLRTWTNDGKPQNLLFYNDVDGAIPRDTGDADYGTGSTATKVAGYLTWDAVEGAASYDIQVSPTQSFSASTLVLSRSNFKGTRLPLIHLPDDTYFWRVRSVAPNGTESAWSDGGGTSFDVRWVDAAWNDDDNTYPDYDEVTSDLRIGWTPVHGASGYWVQASTRQGCFWDDPDNDETAPEFYGTWVGQDRDDAGNPMFPSAAHCRLTDVHLTTLNNWITLQDVLSTTVVEKMNTECDDPGPPEECYPVPFPMADLATWPDVWPQSSLHGLHSRIYWRVRPIFNLSQATESGWDVSSDEGEIYGRWLEDDTPGYVRPYRFQVDPGSAGASVAVDGAMTPVTRCESDDNPGSFCAALVGTEMFASDSASAPGDSTTMQMPLFRWDPFALAGGYILQISRDPDFTTAGAIVRQEFVPFERSSGYGFQASFAPLDGLPDNSEGTGYWWRAVPCDSEVVLDYMSPCTPLYYGPAVGVEGEFNDNAVAQGFIKESSMQTEVVEDFAGTSPLLKWADSTAATDAEWARGLNGADYYEVELSTNPFFSGDDVESFSTAAPRLVPYSGSIDDQQILENGVWYWRVRAVDRDGLAGGWSTGDPFTKRIPAPVVASPVTQVGAGITAEWDPVEDADAYQLQWSTVSTFSSGVGSIVTTQTAGALPDDPATYYWRVRAIIDGEYGLWSSASASGPLGSVTDDASIAYAVSKSGTLTAMKKLDIDGQLKVDGEETSGELVSLQRKNTTCNVSGTYQNIDQEWTGHDGRDGVVRMEVQADRNRCYRFAWDSGAGMVYSAPIATKVKPAATLQVNVRSVRRNRYFKTRVTTNRAIKGRLLIQYHNGSYWSTIRVATLTNRRKYTTNVKINRAGNFKLRAVWDRMTTSGGYKSFEKTYRYGPRVRVNDLWKYYG